MMNKYNQTNQYQLPLITDGRWCDQAMELLRVYLQQNTQPFLFEDFHTWAKDQGLEEPEKPSSWGPLAGYAQRKGLIIKIGLADAISTKRTGHQMKVWIAA